MTGIFAFFDEHFIKQSQPISAPLQINKLPLFSSQKSRPKPVIKGAFSLLKNDCSFFSRLYIACQSRSGNLEEFFKHENQPWPPSLSKMGDLRTGSKEDLVKCLLKFNQDTVENKRHIVEDIEYLNITTKYDTDEHSADFKDSFQDREALLQETVSVPVREIVLDVQAKVLDDAAIVQMLTPKLTRTFQDYVDNFFLPYVSQQLECSERVDIVWNVYKDSSLKNATRER